MILFLAFFLVGAFFLSKANAQYSFYGTNVSINQAGTSNTSMTIEFLEPARLFRFTIFGKIENFNYSDDLEIPGCAVTTIQTSIINCNFGIGDALSVTSISKTAFEQGKNIDIASPSPHFPTLCKFNPYYKAIHN